MIGPTLGGFLYEIQGFELPFLTTGIILVLVAIAILILVRNPGMFWISLENLLTFIHFVR